MSMYKFLPGVTRFEDLPVVSSGEAPAFAFLLEDHHDARGFITDEHGVWQKEPVVIAQGPSIAGKGLSDKTVKIPVRHVQVEQPPLLLDDYLASIGYDLSLLPKEMREPWPVYFMRKAEMASDRTTCRSRAVGAVFVRGKSDVMTGFNGVPPEYPHPKSCARRDAGCKSGERLDMCPCNHAERNGIAQAARLGIALEGTTVYTTVKPCVMCMGDLAVAGISKVVYFAGYEHNITDNIAMYAGIEVVTLEEELRFTLNMMHGG